MEKHIVFYAGAYGIQIEMPTSITSGLVSGYLYVQQMCYKPCNVKNSLCLDIPSKRNVSLKSENTGWAGLWTSLCFSDLTAIQSEGKDQPKEDVC